MKEDLKTYEDLVAETLARAQKLGATAASVDLTIQQGLTATVRLNEPETIAFNHDKTLHLTLYRGQQKAATSINEFHPDSIQRALEIAYTSAGHTQPDEYAGLPDPDFLAIDIPDLDLYHPWEHDVTFALAQAQKCEEIARHADARITNSDGATFTGQRGCSVHGNSHGFLHSYPSSYYSLSCSVIAHEAESMQNSYDYTNSRVLQNLDAPENVGQQAAQKAVKRLHARKMATTTAPVIFAKEVAGHLFNSVLTALSGRHLYKKSSFLAQSLDKQICTSTVTLTEAPYLPQGLYSTPFDAEGVAPSTTPIIKAGVVNRYLLASYSARKLGLSPTGNAGGAHNVLVKTDPLDLPDLLKKMSTGLLVTDLMGHGINITNGDYSRGVAGYWVENGEIAYPVEEITIAGNLRDMLKNIVNIGCDLETRGRIQTGSILIAEMTIAGT